MKTNPMVLDQETIEAINIELSRAKEKHPEGPTLAGVLKCAGDLATAMLFESPTNAGAVQGPISRKAAFQAVQLICVAVRLVQGI
jgi:hypothetical protein